MDILLLNDDGPSLGHDALLEYVLAQGHSASSFIPTRERSGSGSSASFGLPVSVRRIDDMRYVVGGTPIDCAILGLNRYKSKHGKNPDFCIVGINPGLNYGPCARYSGTVSTGALVAYHGIPTIAISTAVDWMSSVEVLNAVFLEYLSRKPEADLCLNINIASPRPSKYHLDVVSDQLVVPHVTGIDTESPTISPCAPTESQEFQLLLGFISWTNWHCGAESDRKHLDLLGAGVINRLGGRFMDYQPQ